MKTIKFIFVFLFLSSFSAFTQAPTYWAYWDNDLDGHASKFKVITADLIVVYLNAGWFVVDHQPALDCDDNNDLVFHYGKVWEDKDGDKRAAGYKLMCYGTSAPTGYILEANIIGYLDCDDNDPTVWRSIHLFIDKDMDGRSVGTSVKCIGSEVPVGFTLTPKSRGDCDDNDGSVWRYACLSNDPCTANWSACIGDIPPAGTRLCIDEGPCNPKVISVNVYPNPVSDKLNISTNEIWNERTEIKLVDQYARIVKVLQVPSAVKGQAFSINTNDLKPGIYQLSIKRGEIVETKAIAVKL